MRIGYADPPYPGMAHKYRDHPDYGGEVDHHRLITDLARGYDGWCLHTASTTLAQVLPLCPPEVRVMAWVKPFASFKPGVPVAYAWEPVIVMPARAAVNSARMIYRDWLAEPITMRRGLTGAKPERVCWWLFEVMGCHDDDDLDDLYPGTGAVTRAWDTWRAARATELLPIPPATALRLLD